MSTHSTDANGSTHGTDGRFSEKSQSAPDGGCANATMGSLAPPVDEMTDEYLTSLCWSSTIEGDDGAVPADSGPEISDEMHAKCRSDVEKFMLQNSPLIDEAINTKLGYSYGQAMHDFALTRNHHGAGFWDRDLGPVGDTLTSRAQAFGETDVYLGDDDMLHIEGEAA